MSNEHSTPVPPASGSAVPARHELRLLLPEEKTNLKTVFGGAGLSHVALILLVAIAIWARPDRQVRAVLDDFPLQDIVFLEIPGPGGGGGGGGDQSPEPPKTEPVPAVKPQPEPEPIPTPAPPKPEPIPEPEPEPEPVALAPIVPTETQLAVLGSAPAVDPTKLGTGVGPGAGSGAGAGVGSGKGDGVGSGEGGGCCEGVVGLGSGVTPPVALYQPKPNYTSEGMMRRVQGEVHMDCVVTTTGTVGKCDIVKSLDSNTYGLDSEAMRTARLFRFRPATRKGVPVAVMVRIELVFNIR